ncbi:uncharacterized protein LOC124306621 isoform X1 [Neodiprion virginianus]|uniref:uncharacterized protein LOC124306621 isoform X1 n=1 Tax=Neodiprion virginianus TaxID=2961670 RepID=UPI001EE6BCE1|nr:uncharacterized protein LOC124306621 isoform X1 [Neodiprion virginianus]
MEISKSLQDEIHSVQNKLKYAIQNHQVYVGKLNDDPNNDELLGQLHEIQEHIISLSKCQKQVVQRLRKEVKLYEAANSNGGKVSIGSLLGLNNNDSITNNNVTKSRETEQTVNGNNFNVLSRRLSKDDYEDEIQNVDPPSPNHHFRNNCPRERTRFNRIDSNDKDIVEIETDENSTEKPIPDDMYRDLRCEQQNFLGCLGLITADKHRELQNKRAERKRRSTANPQFVYSNWEIPTKRKRHSYLQSNGTAPQTRQTTARLNGPSPPPSKVGRLKSSSPPCAASAKSLIPTQKSSTRPNILRNNQESKVFAGKTKSENNLSHKQQSNAKSVTSVGGKAVHIPGLPSSLTIERIENICRAVCVLCRKSDSTLEVCEVCGTYFHATCHVASSPTFRTCPKCTTKTEESDCDQNSSDTLAIETKREIEIATASNTPRDVGKTREDSEVHKTSGGFHKADAAAERPIPAALGVNQLPSSTFLIPIVPNSIPSSTVSTTVSSSSSSSTFDVHQSETTVSSATPVNSGESNISTPYSSILVNQLSRPPSIESDTKVTYAYQFPITVGQQEKSQSYLIVKKISESSKTTARSKQLSSSSISSTVPGNKPDRRSSISATVDAQQSPNASSNDDAQSDVKSLAFRELLGRFKNHNGQEPAKPCEDTPPKPVKSESTNSFNGEKCLIKQHSKLNINQLRTPRQSNSFIPLHSIIGGPKTIDKPDVAKESSETRKVGQSSCEPVAHCSKAKSKTNLLYSLFSSNNESHSFTGSFVQSQDPAAEQIQSEFKLQSPENCESKCDKLKPGVHSSSVSNFSEYVKLEEAHLSAPFRPNLERKSPEELSAISEKKEDSVLFLDVNEGDDVPLHATNDSLESETRDNDADSKIVKEMADINPDFTSFEEYHNENLKTTLNFIAIEKKHSNTYIKFHNFDECSDSGEDERSDKTRRQETIRQDLKILKNELSQKKNYLALRKKFLPPKIKPEFERQDLPMNDHELIIKDAEDNDRIILLGKSSITTLSEEESKAKLGINVVSTENMQVLEQFESAMLEVDKDETTNC